MNHPRNNCGQRRTEHYLYAEIEMDITTQNLESRNIQWTNCTTPTLQLQTRVTSRDTDNIRQKTQNQGRPQETQTTLGTRPKTRGDLKRHRQHQAQDTKPGATSRDTDNIRHKTQYQGRPQETQTKLGTRHKTRGDRKRHRQHQAQDPNPGAASRDTDNIRHKTQNQGRPQETQTTLGTRHKTRGDLKRHRQHYSSLIYSKKSYFVTMAVHSALSLVQFVC